MESPGLTSLWPSLKSHLFRRRLFVPMQLRSLRRCALYFGRITRANTALAFGTIYFTSVESLDPTRLSPSALLLLTQLCTRPRSSESSHLFRRRLFVPMQLRSLWRCAFYFGRITRANTALAFGTIYFTSVESLDPTRLSPSALLLLIQLCTRPRRSESSHSLGSSLLIRFGVTVGIVSFLLV
jgi:hypothetical protein